MSSSSDDIRQNAEYEDIANMDELNPYEYGAARYFEEPRGRPTPPTHIRRNLPPIYGHRPGTDHGVSRSHNSSTGRTSFRPRPNAERHIERHLDRYRRARTTQDRSSDGPRELQRAVNDLDAASSNLRALLDDPIPTIPPPGLISLSAGNDSPSEAEPGRRNKRRKLDMEKKQSEYKAFSYGYHGQVVPGQLHMEIASCDGGSFESDSNMHAAENVLKDDRSVYCTKANRCNLILRHQGDRPFCLDELVIKAPPRGYTAP